VNASVTIVAFGWVFVALALFIILPKRRAVLMSMIGGWLFLPIATFQLPLIPDYDKFTAVCGTTFIAAAVTDGGRILSIRPRWYDFAIIVWVIVPFASSISNNLGPYDGLSAALTHLIRFGLPYWLGRVYFNDREGVRELLIGLIIGGMVYAPLCLIEIRLSPNLHYWVYGYHQIKSHVTKRLGGYRPVVFLSHGIELGLFMANAALAAWWLWRTRLIRQILGIPIGIIAVGLIVTTILCKSLNAYFIGTVCVATLLVMKHLRLRMALLALALVPIGFVALRAGTGWEAKEFVEFVSSEVDPERGTSMESRIANEQRMLGHDWKRPIFGWGGWGRNRPDDELADQGEKAITDSWWIIAFGSNGLVGLISLGATLILPALLVFGRSRGLRMDSPEIAASVGLAVIVLGFSLDCLANAMINPFYFMAVGSLCGLIQPVSGLPYVRAERVERTRGTAHATRGAA